MLLSTALVALSLLAAAVSPVSAGSSPSVSGLHRRRCRANHGLGSGGGAINVGSSPTSTDDDDAPPKQSDSPKPSNSSSSSNLDNEYGFLGFSHAVNDCPSKGAMTDAFKRMKSQFGARYVRTYGACDRGSFANDIIEAADDADIGVFYLVWFGFDGGSQWKTRLNAIVDAAKSNPAGRRRVKSITIGSEPLFDHAISAGELANQIQQTKNRLGGDSPITVSTSEMPYLISKEQNVLDKSDNHQLNVLPFFAGDATRGSNARSNVLSSLNSIPGNKKRIMTQTGWPTNDSVWKANSRSAVASADSAKSYYDLLDDLCPQFKAMPGGGAGWFAHTYSDAGLPGWGVTNNGQAKYNFSPRTKC